MCPTDTQVIQGIAGINITQKQTERKLWVPISNGPRRAAKPVQWPKFPWLNREALTDRADEVSRKFQRRVRARAAAANRATSPKPYEMPSQKADEQSWKDTRLNGKAHCRGSSGNPSKYFYANEKEQSRHDALITGQRQEAPPVKIGLEEQQHLWEAGRLRRARYLDSAKKLALHHHNVDPEALAQLSEWLSSGVNRGKLSRRVLPNGEHGGNLVVTGAGGAKLRKLLGEGKGQKSGAAQLRGTGERTTRSGHRTIYGLYKYSLSMARDRYGNINHSWDWGFGDPAYYDNIISGRVSYGKPKGDRSKDCVTGKAKRRSEAIDRRESQARTAQRNRKKLSPAEWNDLALRAQLGDAAAREEIHREAKLIAMIMAERRCGRQSFVGNGELVSAGLMGSYSERTGQFGSGVEFSTAKWDPNGGGGFKKFLTNAIKWGMDDYLKNQLPKELSLHAKPNKSGDDPEDDQGSRRYIDLVDDDDVYDYPVYDYQAWSDKLDVAIAGLDDRERLVVTRRHALDGADTIPTLEELGGEMGISRETVRKIETAAARKIGLNPKD
jgi:hypothetical protein